MLSEKKLENVIKCAIEDYGLDNAANQVRREAVRFRNDPQLVVEHGLDPAEVDEHLLEAAKRLEDLAAEKRRKRK